MTCEEVKISLHDYVDQQLNDQMKREIAFHIRSCENCLTEYKKLTKFFLYLKEFPAVQEPPKDIVEMVRITLLHQSNQLYDAKHRDDSPRGRKLRQEKEKQARILYNQQKAGERRDKKQKVKNPSFFTLNKELKRTIITLLPLFAIALGYFIYDLHKYNYPWEVRNINGVLLINGTTIANGNWSQDETLTTEDNSSATVLIPKIGTLDIGPLSVLNLVRAKDGSNEIQINRGTVTINNSIDMPELIVKAENVDIIDRGGQFTVQNTGYEGAIISVKFAFVELEYNGDTYYIDENYSCKVRSGFRPGIPFHKDASDSLKAAIENFDYKNGGESAVEKIIALAKEHDALTLLALIPQVKQLQRQIIFQEISNRFPPPESVTRAGILRLEQEMLYRWWVEIEWQI